MLEQLLAIITQESIYSPIELAKRLNTSPALVEQMMAYLERTEQLKPVSTCQSSHCHGCPISSGCNAKSPRMWSLKM